MNRALLTTIGACLLIVEVAVFSAGCAHKSDLPAEQKAPTSEPALDKPFSGTLRFEKGVGDIACQYKKDKPWKKLVLGESAKGVYALKTTVEGAALSLSQNQQLLGRLWLSSDTQVQIKETEKGKVLFSLQGGKMRVSLFDEQLDGYLVLGSKKVSIAGGDFLAQRFDKKDDPLVTPTALNPNRADWSLAIEMSADPIGLGSLEVGNADAITKLSLKRVTVTATQVGDYVENRVEQIFYNDSDLQLEGTFRFPLPDNSSVTSLAMEIDGRLMLGELVEREKARKTYESIVNAMRDPALLEWQQGQMFKLRVFPIEPKSEKRIVLSFLTPLRELPQGLEYSYVTGGADMQKTIPHFSVKLNGRTVVEQLEYPIGKTVVSVFPDVGTKNKLYVEEVSESVYGAARIVPNWGHIKEKWPVQSPKTRNLLVMLDTSRSILEDQKLAVDALEMILDSLNPRDKIMLVASDIESKKVFNTFVPAQKSEIQKALAFAREMQPDGASDLGAAISFIKTVIDENGSSNMQVVYIGDGIATWGETRPNALLTLTQNALGQTPFSAVVLGKGADTQLMSSIAGAQGGRIATPKSPMEMKRFSLFIAGQAAMPRLQNVKISARDGIDIYPKHQKTLFKGEHLGVIFKGNKDDKLPRELILTAQYGSREIKQKIRFTKNIPSKYIAHRWAAKRIEELQKIDGEKNEIVKTSLDFGVMSKYTSFLVLESEQAYKKWNIKRRAKNREEENAPEISGRDLESLDDRDASLHPGNIQPGDPEIRIPAPASARSVVVVFPFGETKIATYDSEDDVWKVRFLIDLDTLEGTYAVLVRITLEDGSVELLTLSYVVDTTAPTVKLSLQPFEEESGKWELKATQIITERDLISLVSRSAVQFEPLETKAGFSPDLRRVEVLMPSGKLLKLRRDPQTGDFSRIFKPTEPLTKDMPLHVVTFDRALNTGVFDVTVSPSNVDGNNIQGE